MPLSFTGPAVATPAIGRDLNGDLSLLVWIVNGFMLAFGSTIMLGGALADQFGRKRMFRLGAIGFTVTSLAVGLSPNVLIVDLLRALQGIAAALTISAGFAAVAQEYEGPARTRALGLLGTGFGIGIAFGPLIAGALIGTLGWRSLFFATALAGVIILVAGVPRMRETRDPGATGIDFWGAGSFTAMLVALIFGIMLGPDRGWGDTLVVALLAGAAILLISFITIENLQKRPMLDLSLFRYARFVSVQALPVAVAYSFIVPFILLPVRFIRIEGMSEMQVGMMLLPLSLPIATIPFIAANIARWIPSGILAGLGLILAGAGVLLLALVPVGSAPTAFILPLAMIGAGAALPWGLMDDLAISVVPTERAGMATGIFGTMRVAGETVAIALVGALMAFFVTGGFDMKSAELPAGFANVVASGGLDEAALLAPSIARAAAAEAYGAAFRNTMLVCAAITFTAALIALVTLRVRKPKPVEEAVMLEIGA
ncbi:MFS transporter [Kaistia sp. 32K]|nr:MFS transporter [Kaistia sp. 32K]